MVFSDFTITALYIPTILVSYIRIIYRTIFLSHYYNIFCWFSAGEHDVSSPGTSLQPALAKDFFTRSSYTYKVPIPIREFPVTSELTL